MTNLKSKEAEMLILLAIILATAWIFGFTVYHVTSHALYLLLLLAAGALVLHFVRGAKRLT